MKTIRYTFFGLIVTTSLFLPITGFASFCPDPSAPETTQGGQIGSWHVTNGQWEPTAKFATVFWMGHGSQAKLACSYYSGLSMEKPQPIAQAPTNGMGNWRCISEKYCMCSGATTDCPLPGI